MSFHNFSNDIKTEISFGMTEMGIGIDGWAAHVPGYGSACLWDEFFHFVGDGIEEF
jgi:hypothetical protein